MARLSPTEWIANLKSGWRDFVRGHTVGHRRDLGYIGNVPFLVVIRLGMLVGVGLRLYEDPRKNTGVSAVLAVMFILALCSVPVARRHREQDHDYWQLGFVTADCAIVTYLVHWAGIFQSDIFLLYVLPLLTAAECLGGRWTAIVIAAITVLYPWAALPRTPGPVHYFILLTRWSFLTGLVVLSLCLLQVTSIKLGDVHRCLRKITDHNAAWVALDAKLDELMRQIKAIGFDFAGLSTVDRYQGFAIMSRAVNIPPGWMRHSRRPLDGHDIIPEVARNELRETPASDDPRFEQVTYRVFKHDELTRVYVPVVTVEGTIAVVQAGWEKNSEKGPVIPEHIAAELENRLRANKELIEQSRPFKFLQGICEYIQESLHGCIAVMIHLDDEAGLMACGHWGTYSDVFVGALARDPGPIRDALVSGRNVWLRGRREVEERCPKFYENGCRTFVAVPLPDLKPSGTGVVSLLFSEQHQGRWFEAQISLLARAVESAIQARLLIMDSERRSARAWMQSRLKTIENALERNAEPDELVQRVAEHVVYNFEADCVTVYEYQRELEDFRTPPVVAGHILAPDELAGGVVKENILFQRVQDGNSFFKDIPPEYLEPRPGSSTRFSVRERIHSFAVLVLKAEDTSESTGLMFVNYRRKVNFSPELRASLVTLASTASVAIRTARQMKRRQAIVESMSEIENLIANTGVHPDLNKILTLILEKSCTLTDAEFAELWLFTEDRELVECRAVHGCGFPRQRRVASAEATEPVGKALELA